MPRLEGDSIPKPLQDPSNLSRELFGLGARPIANVEVRPFEFNGRVIYVETSTDDENRKVVTAITHHRSVNLQISSILAPHEMGDRMPREEGA